MLILEIQFNPNPIYLITFSVAANNIVPIVVNITVLMKLLISLVQLETFTSLQKC